MELSWSWFTLFNVTTFNLYIICSHLQMDIFSFFVFWHCNWRDDFSWRSDLALPPLHQAEVMNKLTNCKPKQIQRQDIIVQAACEPPDGILALYEIALHKFNVRGELWLGIGITIVSILIILVFLCIRYTTPKRLRSAPNKP